MPTKRPLCQTWARMSHPDPNGPPDRRPIKVGEVWENPVTGERAVILELPWDNPASRVTAELTALVGARVMGEHRHPALVEQFTVLEGELSVKRNEHTSILREGETAVIEPGVWHDWSNASERDARVRVEITPGDPPFMPIPRRREFRASPPEYCKAPSGSRISSSGPTLPNR
jgi:quercetin dioxygenase-like cupin family protein